MEGAGHRSRAIPAIAAIALLATAGGCGDERAFDAASIVEELNAAGAEVALGEPLPSSEEGVEVSVLEIAAAGGGGGGTGHSGHSHGAAGTVVILTGEEAAREEFARCDSALSFVCFRAGNAVLRMTGLAAEQERRLTTAIQALETESE